jgi:hypothetical protein
LTKSIFQKGGSNERGGGGGREGDTEKDRITEKGGKREKYIEETKLNDPTKCPRGKPAEVHDMCSVDEIHNKHKSLA